MTLNVLDVAGNLQLTQGMIDEFVAQNPDVVSRVTYEKAAAPEMAGKIKAQQDAGRIDIDLVLTGTDGLSAGAEQGLFTPLLPQFADRLTGMNDYLEPAAAMQELAGDQGVVITYYPSGPLIEYAPDRVPEPAEHRRGTARLREGPPRQGRLRAPVQLRARPHLPDGAALHPRRLRPRRTR